MLLPGAPDRFHSTEVETSRLYLLQTLVQSVKPHHRVRMNFAVLPTRDKARRCVIVWKILPEVDGVLDENFA